jgi:pimeloyl-ACP methyl ester carboxylesterase
MSISCGPASAVRSNQPNSVVAERDQSQTVVPGAREEVPQAVPYLIQQETFQPCDFQGDTGLNVHQSKAQRSSVLVVFVHGLGGHGYRTWGALPEIIFNDKSNHRDVAVFDYASGLRRQLGRRDPVARDIAEELTGELREVISIYEHIFLVGHSMGGTVAELAVKLWFDRQPRYSLTAITPIAALLTIATPRAGSLRMPRILGFHSDARFLRPHSAISRELDVFSSTHLETRLTDQPMRGRILLPRFALVANSDKWVDYFSVTFSLPAGQVRLVRGSHSSIVKPRRPNATVVLWLQECIEHVLLVRRRVQLSSITGLRVPAPPVIVTRFLGNFDEPDWEYAYLVACRDLEAEIGIQVVDSRDLVESIPISIAVRVIASSSVNPDNIIQREVLMADSGAQQLDGHYTLAISPNGIDHETAVSVIKAWIGEGPAGVARWIHGSNDVLALRKLVFKWLRTLAARYPHRYRNEDDQLEFETLRSELPRNLDETDTSRPRYFGGAER